MSLLLGMSAFLLVGSAAGDFAEQPLETAEHVDLRKYVGLWYEVAKVPNRFQSQCVGGTTAEYTLRDDGRIDVVNRCRTNDGSSDEARGIAKIEDHASNARLKVSFVRVLGISLFWGDYWILEVGQEYEYAVIGNPSRKYGWVLSRTPRLDSGTLAGIFERLRQQGYDPDAFEITQH